MLILALTSAYADQLAQPEPPLTCADADNVLLPSDGNADFEVDGAPAFVLDLACNPNAIRVDLSQAGVPVSSSSLDATGLSTGARYLYEPGWPLLLAETDYSAEVFYDDALISSASFRTGTRMAAPLTTGPSALQISSATLETVDQVGVVTVTGRLTPTTRDGERLVVLLDGNTERIWTTTASSEFSGTWSVASTESRACLTVEERDTTGEWHGPGTEVCENFTIIEADEKGCSTSPRSPVLFGLLLLPLLRRRT